MSFMEPMNAPNLILLRDDDALSHAPAVGDFDQLADAIRPLHEERNMTAPTMHLSPFSSPEDIRVELRKASAATNAASKRVQLTVTEEADTHGVLDTVKDAVTGTASSISSAIQGASDWARERLNGAPHTHEMPARVAVEETKPKPAATLSAHSHRPFSDRLPVVATPTKPQPLIATPLDVHSHVDMFDAAGHRVSEEKLGHLEGVGARTLVADRNASPAELSKAQQERARARKDAAAHEFLHSKLLVGSEAHTSAPRAEMPEQLLDDTKDKASNLTAPALGADIDASDGLAEAGAALGRGLLSGLFGAQQDRSVTLLATSRGVRNATIA